MQQKLKAIWEMHTLLKRYEEEVTNELFLGHV